MSPRLFEMHRLIDFSGVSGPGHVADGVVFEDGAVAIRWRSETPSTETWDSLDAAIKVHGHDGATEFRFTRATESNGSIDRVASTHGRDTTINPLEARETTQKGQHVE